MTLFRFIMIIILFSLKLTRLPLVFVVHKVLIG